MYLFDTNVVSALRFPDRQPPELRAWASRIDFVDCFLSIITLLEIEIGVQRLERRDQWGSGAAWHWSPSPERDALIGATAIVHDLTMVTRNTSDFARFPLRLLDPWQAG